MIVDGEELKKMEKSCGSAVLTQRWVALMIIRESDKAEMCQ